MQETCCHILSQLEEKSRNDKGSATDGASAAFPGNRLCYKVGFSAKDGIKSAGIREVDSQSAE